LPTAAAQIPRVAEIDDELMARVLQWCAEAGRTSSPEDVRDVLSPLSWDALLAVRAVLADAPPARPLGPKALVEIARGVSPEIAAERERDGTYRSEPSREREEASSAPASPTPPAQTKRTRGKSTRRVATVVIRRARDRHDVEIPREAPPPLIDELFKSEGRAVLQRWLRTHGGRRARLVEEVARWRRPDGSPAGAEELTRLLDAHGLTRPFERREREEVLHAVRASGGRLAGAARALTISQEALGRVIDRLGIGSDVERFRHERREDIRRRATLGDRVRLLVDEAERLEDLGMTAEIEADVRDRLRQHADALRAGSGRHVAASFAHTLGITREQASSIATRFGMELQDSTRSRAPRLDGDGHAPARAPNRRPPPRGERPPTGSPRPPPGGGRPMSGSPRPPSAGGRPMSAGPRPPPRGGRPMSGSPRPPSTGGRPMSAGARPPPRGGRPMSGGPRPPSGGARSTSRSPRAQPGKPARGGARPAAPRGESSRPRKPPSR
jgi:hypothetical protein